MDVSTGFEAKKLKAKVAISANFSDLCITNVGNRSVDKIKQNENRRKFFLREI